MYALYSSSASTSFLYGPEIYLRVIYLQLSQDRSVLQVCLRSFPIFQFFVEQGLGSDGTVQAT
jgi:hypothetical protein